MDETVPLNRRWSIGMIKRKMITESEDQSEGREKWVGKADFFLCCLGYAVGLGNIWRFPYLCYRNGGGVFFIPYFICLFCCGIPLVVLEMSVGQFSSCGPYHAWDFVKGFRGIGISMALIASLIVFYYNTIIGWAVYYFFASFSSNGLPWAKCGDWSTQLCKTRLKPINQTLCRMTIGLSTYANGTCYNTTSGTIYGIYDEKIADTFGIKPTLPAAEYLGYVGLQTKLSTGLSDLGGVRWDMTLCILLAWILVFSSLISGVKSVGKVVYFSATFPYVLLIILFFRGIFQEGSAQGVLFYIKPDVTKLADRMVWKDAAMQIFFSLSLSMGGMTVYASFNRFHKDIIRDAIACSICNCLTSVFAGFVIFSFLGGYAKSTGVSVDKVVSQGVELAFIVYAQACTYLPVANLWALLFFFMLILLGLDSAFSLIEAGVICVVELRPKWMIYRRIILVVYCCIMFFFALSMATPGGASIVGFFDENIVSYNVMFLGMIECAAVALYGPQRMAMDIETMIGGKTMGFMPWRIMKWWFIACWCVITPAILLFIFVYSLYSKYSDKKTLKSLSVPREAVGWLLLLSTLVPLFVIIISTFIKAKGNMGMKVAEFLAPTKTWGPYSVKHRKLVTYVEEFPLNPRSLPVKEENEPTQSAAKHERSEA